MAPKPKLASKRATSKAPRGYDPKPLTDVVQVAEARRKLDDMQRERRELYERFAARETAPFATDLSDKRREAIARADYVARWLVRIANDIADPEKADEDALAHSDVINRLFGIMDPHTEETLAWCALVDAIEELAAGPVLMDLCCLRRDWVTVNMGRAVRPNMQVPTNAEVHELVEACRNKKSPQSKWWATLGATAKRCGMLGPRVSIDPRSLSRQYSKYKSVQKISM